MMVEQIYDLSVYCLAGPDEDVAAKLVAGLYLSGVTRFSHETEPARHPSRWGEGLRWPAANSRYVVVLLSNNLVGGIDAVNADAIQPIAAKVIPVRMNCEHSDVTRVLPALSDLVIPALSMDLGEDFQQVVAGIEFRLRMDPSTWFWRRLQLEKSDPDLGQLEDQLDVIRMWAAHELRILPSFLGRAHELVSGPDLPSWSAMVSRMIGVDGDFIRELRTGFDPVVNDLTVLQLFVETCREKMLEHLRGTES